MVKKIYKKLSDDQIRRGVIFSSCLSEFRTETENNTIHEVFKTDDDKHEAINRLLDDKFFNKSHFNFNIVRS